MFSVFARTVLQEPRTVLRNLPGPSNLHRLFCHASASIGLSLAQGQPFKHRMVCLISLTRQYSSQKPISVSLSRRRRIGARVPSRWQLGARSQTKRVAAAQAVGTSNSLAATTTSTTDTTTNEKTSDKLFPVLAIHIAQTIDLSPVLSTIFARDFIKKQMFHKNSFVVQLPPHAPQDPPRYVAVFRFGSVVCINMSPRERNELVANIKKLYAREPVLEGSERTERFGIMLLQPKNQQQHLQHDANNSLDGVDEQGSRNNEVSQQQQQTPSRIVTGDYCVVPELDMNGVAVISNILAQTVALDSYNDMVDDMLSQFAKINSSITSSGVANGGNGKFDASHKQFLFQTVAKNNSIFIDMISKIRIKDRNDTAWNLTKYQDIHSALRDEFEIDDRFDSIEMKLNLIQQNAKFFLEVLQSQKSNTLEWIIVGLIAVECCIMCMDMSGLGEKMIGMLSSGN
ncbi:hypothetical protein MPSEU_000015200 [Mayamaea pseudoterrestris]|nr:hypothetical protein MPSEU_000015200 [Mayamaea pseudoterrestris]